MKKKIYKDVKKFTVSRSSWLRGTNVGELLNNDGNMCCLGFYATACGLRKPDIRDMVSPVDVIIENDKDWDTKLVKPSGKANTKVCNRLMAINDNRKISDTKREKLLTDKFEELGIKIEFVD